MKQVTHKQLTTECVHTSFHASAVVREDSYTSLIASNCMILFLDDDSKAYQLQSTLCAPLITPLPVLLLTTTSILL